MRLGHTQLEDGFLKRPVQGSCVGVEIFHPEELDAKMRKAKNHNGVLRSKKREGKPEGH